MYRNGCSSCKCSMNNNKTIETICDDYKSSNSITPSGDLFPSNPMLAQSYVPIQYMDKTFSPQCGLKNGTIFPELVNKYYPGQSMMDIDYIRMVSSEV